MSEREPNMVDVALKLPEAGDVLSLIADHMAADAAHRSEMMNAWLIEAKAESKLLDDGMTWALGESTWGGTTAQYEVTLDRVRWVQRCAGYINPIKRWYIEQFTEDLFTKAVHPSFLDRPDGPA